MSGPTLGPKTPTHPISGEPKREQENILNFARRHGWEVIEEGAQDDYYHSAQLKEGDQRLSLSFWPGNSHSIALANGGTGSRFMKIPDPLRERVERFLLGIECVCPEQPDVIAAYECVPNPACPIHGDEPNA